MREPTIVHVLYFEWDPQLGGPTEVLGVFHDDDHASSLDHARARAGILFGAHVWTHFSADPPHLRQRWECAVEEGVVVIEPHPLEPVPAPPRTGRRPRYG